MQNTSGHLSTQPREAHAEDGSRPCLSSEAVPRVPHGRDASTNSLTPEEDGPTFASLEQEQRRCAELQGQLALLRGECEQLRAHASQQCRSSLLWRVAMRSLRQQRDALERRLQEVAQQAPSPVRVGAGGKMGGEVAHTTAGCGGVEMRLARGGGGAGEVEVERDSLRRELSTSHRLADQLQEQLAGTKEQLASTKEHLASIKEQLASLQEQSRTREGHTEALLRLEFEKRCLTNQLQAERGRLADLKGRLEKQAEEQRSHSREHKLSSKQLAEARKEGAKLRDQLQKLKEATLQAIYFGERQMVDEILKSKTRALKVAQEEHSREKEALSAARSERQQLEQSNARSRVETAASEERLARALRESKTKDGIVRELRSQLEGRREAEQLASEARIRAEEKAKATTGELGCKERLIAELRSKLQAVQTMRHEEQADAEQRAVEQATEGQRRLLERRESALRACKAKLEQCQQELRALQEAKAGRGSKPSRGGETILKEARELKILLMQLAHTLEEGVDENQRAKEDYSVEEQELAFLSQSLLQVSPSELGIGPHASAAQGEISVGMLSQHQRQLQAALSHPIDSRAAFTVLVRMMQQRIEAVAEQRSTKCSNELLRLDCALSEYDERLKGIKQQVQAEQFKAEVEIAQRDAEIAQLKELAQQAGQTIVYHTGIDALSDVVGEQSCLGERSHVSDIFVN
ncbi:MAG: hypothetical protein SGPRY_006758 [Prymnesium sp.]